MWESGHIANIHMNRVDIKSYGLPTGTQNSVNENPITAELPAIVVALVDSQNLIGQIDSNPFVLADSI